MRPGDYAWCVIGVGVLAWDALCPRGELLSEACDRYRSRCPVVTYVVIGYVALHLARLCPRAVDPLYQIATRVKR